MTRTVTGTIPNCFPLKIVAVRWANKLPAENKCGKFLFPRPSFFFFRVIFRHFDHYFMAITSYENFKLSNLSIHCEYAMLLWYFWITWIKEGKRKKDLSIRTKYTQLTLCEIIFNAKTLEFSQFDGPTFCCCCSFVFCLQTARYGFNWTGGRVCKRAKGEQEKVYQIVIDQTQR